MHGQGSTRRSIWLIGVLLVLALVTAACGDDVSTTTPATTQAADDQEQPSAAETDETDTKETDPAPDETVVEDPAPADGDGSDGPTPGGTLVVALSEDPGHFNPGITTGFNVHAVTGSMFNGLVELDDNANPLPDLASSWEVSDDSTQYTFQLVEGVQWHDGQPFTSADVKFTFESVLLEFHSRTKSGLSSNLESITTPDDNTVVFTFSQPYAALLQRLNSTEAPILPRHIYEGVDDVQTAEANLNPVGTGPYVFESYDVDDQITLVRNDNYFKDGLPHLDRVIYRVIPDANTQLLALEEGEIDYMWRVPGGEIERLSGGGVISLSSVNSGPGGGFCVPSLTFNLDREIFADIRVRQAIAHAIDRDQLLELAVFGQGNVATGPISSELEFAHTDDVTMYAHDIVRANELLDEAGFASDGTRFTIDLLLFPTFVKYGEVIRQNLSEVGIEVDVTPLDRSALIPRVFGDRDFDTNVISYCNNTDPSIGVSRMYISSNIGDIPFSNGAGYVNSSIDELFAQGESTADADVRGDIYGEIQRLLVDELPYWWLLETRFTVGSRASVMGLQPNSGHFAETAWVAEG